MLPTIAPGERITVAPADPGRVVRGDVLMFRSRGRLLTHRVAAIQVGTCGEREFLLRGDAKGGFDAPVRQADVLGRVVGVERRGKLRKVSGMTANLRTALRAATGGLRQWLGAGPMLVVRPVLVALLSIAGLTGSAEAAVAQRVQSGTAVNTANGVQTITISSVDTTKSFLIVQARSSSNRPVGSTVRGRLASATTIEFERVTDGVAPEPAAINIQWYVVTFGSGVKVQRGEVTQSAATVNVPITAVAAVGQAFVLWSKTMVSTDTSWEDDDAVLGEITSTTNLQFRSNVAAPGHTIAWQVVEFTNPADINVQKGTTAMTGTTTSVAATLGTAVDVIRTFVLVGWRSSGTGNDIGARMLRARLTDSTTVTIDRSISGSPDDISEIVWQAIELKDGSRVWGGNAAFGSGVSEVVADLGAPGVPLTRTVAFGSGQGGPGQNLGRSDLTADDIVGVAAVTASLGPAFRSASSAAAGSGVLTLTINVPAATRFGDVMIASIGFQPQTAVVTPASGWTLVRRTDSATGNALATYWKAATDTEPATYGWTFNTSTGSTGGILSFAGVDPANPVDVDSGQSTASSLNHDTPNVTTTTANEMVVTAHSFMSSATWTPPAGMTEAVDVASEAIGCCGESIEINYGLQVAAGATGVRTAMAANDADAGNTHIVALRRANATSFLRLTRDDTTSTADVGWFVVEFNQGRGFKVGSFTKSTGAGPLTQAIAHGLGEVPKAIILWTDGKTNETGSGSYLFGFGMTDGTTSKSVATASQDSVSPMNASTRMASKALTIVQWSEVLVAEADLQSWTDTSFTLNWTTNNATAYVIHYVVVGGSDVSAKVLEWTTATATGNQAVTGVGFQPDAVIHAHGTHAFTAALPASIAGAGFGLGAMDADGDQWASTYLTVDNVGTSDTQRGQQTNGALYSFNNTLTVQKKASWVSMNADGFTVNFTNAASAAAARVLSLALKGINVKPGSFLKSTNAAPATQSIAGVGFRPGVVLLTSAQDVTRGGPVAESRFGLGASDGTTQGSIAIADRNGSNNSKVDGLDKTSKVFLKDNNTITAVADAEADLVSLDGDGFTLNWTTNDAVQTEVLYLAFAPIAATEVRLLSLNATRYASGVLVDWKTGYEVDNLGFHVYRDLNGQRTRITRSPIAGSGLMAGQGTAVHAEQRYAIWDLDPAGAEPSATYWLEDVDFNGTSTWHGPVIPVLGTLQAPSNTATSASLRDVGEDRKRRGKMFRAEGAGIERPRKAAGERAPNAALGTHQALAGQPAVKIGINRPGWYRVSQPELLSAGLDAHVDPRRLKLFVDGVEQLMTVGGAADGRFDPADAVEFYGTGVDTPFTDTRIYWLVSGAQRAQRMAVVGAAPTPAPVPPPGSFEFTVQEKERSIFFAGLRNGDNENWFGAFISEEPTELSVSVTNVNPAIEGSLELTLQGVTATPGVDPDHDVSVSVNGTAVSELRFDGQASASRVLSIPAGVLHEGNNTVTLTARGGEADYSLVDVIRLSYGHTYNADADMLRFTVEAPGDTRVGGFASQAIRVVDITDSLAPTELRGQVSQDDRGWWAVALRVPSTGRRTLLAFTDLTVATPMSLRPNSPSSWYSSRNAADYIAVSHGDFVHALAPLADARARQGHATAIVDIEDVYDEFSFGEKSPQALKDFVTRARSSWKRAPRFLVLAGDATMDPRDYAGLGGADFVPTKQVPMARVSLETASDDWFADGDDDGVPEMAVGRLPVRTAAQAATVVRKVLNYERDGAQPWTRDVLLVSDQNDSGSNFDEYTSRLTAELPAGYTAHRISRSTLDGASARQALIDRVNDGQLIVNYQGHGSVRIWGRDGILLTDDDIRTGWRNNGRLPFVVAMNCLNGFFHGIYGEESLAETLLRVPDGGAVAAWASSSVTDSATQAVVNQELFRLIFRGAGSTVGEAVALAKRVVSNRDLRRSWIFFGDPAMRLAGVPQQTQPAAVADPRSAPQVGSGSSIAASSIPQGGATGTSESEDPTTEGSAAPSSRLTDWDGDGAADVMLLGPESLRVILSGTGRTSASAWQRHWEAYPANLDGDGRTDLLIFDRASGVLRQSLNRGRATFRTIGETAWGTQWQVHVGDFNGDRLDDVLLTDPVTALWQLGLNDRRGAFSFSAGSWPTAATVTVGDYSGDGRADAFLYDPAGGRWTVALSARTGTFTTASGTWGRGWSVHAANLNADGRTDLLAYRPGTGRVAECVSGASGSFSCGAAVREAGMQLVVLKGNRRDDELLYDPATGEWNLTRREEGTVANTSGVWARGLTIATGDLDADGREDLLLYDRGTGRWSSALARGARFEYVAGEWSPGLSLVGRP